MCGRYVVKNPVTKTNKLVKSAIQVEDIENYKNRNFHPDYSGASFTVSKGDVLAVGLDRHFDANKDIDPLQNISSIFFSKLRKNIKH
mgnify:CR=1 FL=1